MAKMISKQTMTVGIFAILAGLVVAYGVRSLLVQEETPPAAPPPASPPVIKLPLAAQDLPADRVVTGHDMIQLPLTGEQIQMRFKGVDPGQMLSNATGIVNRRLKKPIKRGQPFLTTDFYLEGEGPSVALKLQPGFRAIRVQVPDVRQGGTRPGMHVDVFFRAEAKAATKDQLAIPEKTLTLLRDVEVLETDRRGPKRDKPLLVTLAVPEDKADMFAVIEGRGDVWLVPTSSEETAEGASSPVPNASTLAELLGVKAPPPLPPPPRPFETAIYRRNNVQINQFIEGKLLGSRSRELGPKILDTPKSSAPVDSPTAPATPAAPAIPPDQGE